MAENHMAYMHSSFPKSRNHPEHDNPHLNKHMLTHEDPHIRARTEAHSVSGPHIGSMQSGHGHASLGHAMSNAGGHESVGRGTV